MIGIVQQSGGGTVSPGMIIALVLVVVASSLAVVITLGLARRIKAIGDRRPPGGDEDG